MAGLRIGFATASTSSGAPVDAVASYRTNVGYGAPSIVQHAGAWALDHARELAAPVADGYRARRDAAVAAARTAGWHTTPPRGAMYLWLPVPGGADEWTFIRALLDDAGVVVTPGSAFGPGGGGWFRISLVAEPPVLADAIARAGAVCRARGWL